MTLSEQALAALRLLGWDDGFAPSRDGALRMRTKGYFVIVWASLSHCGGVYVRGWVALTYRQQSSYLGRVFNYTYKTLEALLLGLPGLIDGALQVLRKEEV